MKAVEKFSRHIVANAVILLAVAICIFTASGAGAISVFTANDPRVLYKGNTANPKVTLMVNVYWGTEYLDDMLKAFADAQVTTTFFIGGTWADKNDEYLVKIAEAGHELGNHGYFHKDHKKLSEEKNREEITATEGVIRSFTGITTRLFAPPSGSYGKTMINVCDSLGYKIIMFSKDTIDWRDRNEDLIYTRATNVTNGDFVLMHPTPETAKALPKILRELKKKGFRVVTVSENLM